MIKQEGVWHYLDILISGGQLKADCSGLESAIQKWLRGWQAKALSMIGRVALVRSVMSSMLVYLLSNTWVPKTYLLKLE